MQTIFLNNDNLDYWQSCATENIIALGFFDGIHKGHQKVINIAKQEANKKNVDLAVMSFSPHPKVVLSEGKNKVDYLMPLQEKAKQLEKMGVDYFYVVEFDKHFANLSPEQFVYKYLLKLKTSHVVAGYDFTYGKMGAGNIDRLQEDSKSLISTTKVNKVEYLGKKISSTRIRNTINEGQMKKLYFMMGSFYKTKGEVKNNFFLLENNYMLPGDGVYKVTISSEIGVFHTKIENRKKENILKVLDDKLKTNLNKLSVTLIWKEKLYNDLNNINNTEVY